LNRGRSHKRSDDDNRIGFDAVIDAVKWLHCSDRILFGDMCGVLGARMLLELLNGGVLWQWNLGCWTRDGDTMKMTARDLRPNIDVLWIAR
jgi:hypothetical protein